MNLMANHLWMTAQLRRAPASGKRLVSDDQRAGGASQHATR
jgi:hypothetical protein